jgi:protoporphyrinogen oxidase
VNLAILGGGLSGVSLAYLLQEGGSPAAIDILERESVPGGLCRSFPFGNVRYDVGPHIMFSRDASILKLMVRILGENVHKLRRSNRIWHDGRLVKYPFENELSALSEADKQYCLNAFLNNPYTEYVPQNMLQFFLVTFGEGITNLFLRPYNEKIWKFDPSLMDTQMVERIPKPPAEDIIRSAAGVSTEGYVHQLHFFYPRAGGIESVVRGFVAALKPGATLRTGTEVVKLRKDGSGWAVTTADGAVRQYDHVVSTIPIQWLMRALDPPPPEEIVQAAGRLKYNSIIICVLRVKRERLGDNFAITVADRSILFHRMSKVNFLFPPEIDDGTTSILVEVTYRKGDLIDQMDDRQVVERIVGDLCRLGFLEDPSVVLADELTRHQFAYVIYDLAHRQNMAAIRRYCEGELGLTLHGRFGEFEYINMDQVIGRSMARAQELAGRLGAENTTKQ